MTERFWHLLKWLSWQTFFEIFPKFIQVPSHEYLNDCFHIFFFAHCQCQYSLFIQLLIFLFYWFYFHSSKIRIRVFASQIFMNYLHYAFPTAMSIYDFIRKEYSTTYIYQFCWKEFPQVFLPRNVNMLRKENTLGNYQVFWKNNFCFPNKLRHFSKINSKQNFHWRRLFNQSLFEKNIWFIKW